MSDPTDDERKQALAFQEGLDRLASRPPSERQAESRRLAAALRDVIDRAVSGGTPLEQLRDAADLAEKLAERLGRTPNSRRYGSFADALDPTAEPDFFDWSPQFGRANALSAPIDISVDADSATVIGAVVFGTAYEGPPGCVHGGQIAASFDEILGLAQGLGGEVAMTGTLTVRYRRPTPLGVPLRFEGWRVSVSGRKVLTAGRLLAAGGVTAEAEGVFVTVGMARFQQLAAARSDGPAARP